MTTWLAWVFRRARASGTLLATQLLLVVVTTGIIAGTLGWSDATATAAARAALTSDGAGASAIHVRMRAGEDPVGQDRTARHLLAQGFSPAPVSITTEQQEDPSGGTPFLEWTVLPDVERILPDHLAALASGAEQAKPLVSAADTTGRGVTISGDLAPVAEAAGLSFSSARALGWVPLALLLVVTVLGVSQMAGLLAAAREAEVHLLLARGGRPRQLLLAEIGESVVITALGTAIGTLGALAGLVLASSTFSDSRAVLTGGLATGGLVVATLAVTTGMQIRRTTNAATRPDRVRAVAGAATVLVVAAAAALTLWQLRRTGTVVLMAPDGDRSPDLLAAAAPASLLLGSAVLGLVLLGPLTRIIERASHAGISADLSLAASQVSRRLAVQSVPVVLTILATGTSTLAALFAGSAAALEADQHLLERGAAVRATLSTPAASAMAPASVPEVNGLPGVTDAAPVWIDEVAFVGDQELVALVAPLSPLARVAELPRGLAVPELPSSLPSEPAAAPVVVPAGSASLELGLTATVSLDEWESERLRLAYEFGETVAESEAGTEPAELVGRAVEVAGEIWGSAEEPVQLRPAVFVRDLDSGQSELVRGDPLVLDPAVAIDEDDLRNPRFVPATMSGTMKLDIDPGRRLAIDAIHLDISDRSEQLTRTLQVEITLETPAGSLLGDTTAGWTASDAIPAALADVYADERDASLPADVEVLLSDFHGFPRIDFSTNRPYLPSTLDTSAPTWVWSGPSPGELTQVRIGPGVRYTGPDPLGATSGLEYAAAGPVRVALTPAAAGAANLSVGDRFELGLLQRSVPAVLAELTELVPGVGGDRAVVADSAAVGALFARSSSPLPWPDQVWVASQDPAATGAALDGLDGVEGVTVASDGRSASPADETARTFWVASGGAALLALVGIAASSLTQLAHRRPEVAVLRAIGMPAHAQAWSRALEPVLTLVPAAALGVFAGWLVGRLVVVPLAASAVPGSSGMTAELQASVPPWLLLTGATALGMALLVASASRTVARQAGDSTYREEVR